MTKAPNHDELLDAAIQAHQKYVEKTEEVRKARELAFRDAIRGPVTGREIAQNTGLSESRVSRIAKGQR